MNHLRGLIMVFAGGLLTAGLGGSLADGPATTALGHGAAGGASPTPGTCVTLNEDFNGCTLGVFSSFSWRVGGSPPYCDAYFQVFFPHSGGNTTGTIATTRTLPVPAGATGVTYAFDFGLSYDFSMTGHFYVYYGLDGPADQLLFSSDEEVFRRYTFSVDQWAGHTVALRFDATFSGNEDGAGTATLDNVVLQYQSTSPCPPPVHSGMFQDVPPAHPFAFYITCLGGRGIISGYGCGGPSEPCAPDNKPYFRPDASLTRGQSAKIVSISRSWTEPIPSTQQTFEDVPPSQPFWLWIERMAGHGIINGYGCGGPGEPCGPGNRPYFRASNNVTRGQLAKIVSQAAGYQDPLPFGQQLFEDVPPAQPFWTWIERIAGRGIISGYGCGGAGEPCVPPGNRPYYRPDREITRAQTAKIDTNTFFPGCVNPTATPPALPSATATPTTTWLATVTATPTGPGARAARTTAIPGANHYR